VCAQEDADLFALVGSHAKPELIKVARVQVEYIEVSQEDLTKLLSLEKPETSDATELRKKVQLMVEKKEAKVIDTQLDIVRSGAKSNSGSTHQFIYPSEYETSSSQEELLRRLEDSNRATFPVNFATPASFDRRNVGSAFEAQATIREGSRVVEFHVVSEYDWHTGNTVWHQREAENGKKLTISVPDFYQIAVKSSGYSVSGQYTLLSVVSPKNVNGEVDHELTTLARRSIEAGMYEKQNQFIGYWKREVMSLRSEATA